MNTPEIQALGITQEGDPTRWKARATLMSSAGWKPGAQA
jgi:hypothetical protein